MATHICQSLLLGLLCIVLVLASAGSTPDLNDLSPFPCIGPCENCDQMCMRKGYNKGGGCYSMVCCCHF
ncbi:unnamed protein product [Lathyrus oleraceus]